MQQADHYKHFRVALYIRALDIAPLGNDISPLTRQFEHLDRYVHFNKVYLETHRDMVIPDRATLISLKNWFIDRGIAVSAGITVTIDESANFKTYCYTDPYYRDRLKMLVSMTAALFDEILFDDFFFNNCKCPSCIKAKGSHTWTDFRLALMTEASQQLVLQPARQVNPGVQVMIKYPNWYEHFQGLGFNLKDQPALYDGLYTGNETRNSQQDMQHLQPYESYQIFRYYENIKPGGNRGGWVDPFGAVTLDRYAEQIWLTLLAKAPELTLFDYHALQAPIKASQRGSWQDSGTSLSYDQIVASMLKINANSDNETDQTGHAGHAPAAAAALAYIDPLLSNLGNPVGISMYKPWHSRGDDFLVNYLGMIGLPVHLVPEFPSEEPCVILGRSASFDPTIIDKIKQRLMRGLPVVITSGLLEALQDKGMQDIVEMRCTNRRLSTDTFQMGWQPQLYKAGAPVQVPVIDYFTNDSWELISCNASESGTPLLHAADYGQSTLYMLNVPDNPGDLYNLPSVVLGRIARVFAADLPVFLEAPSRIALFLYDNQTFAIYSFRDELADVKIWADQAIAELVDLSADSLLDQPVSKWLPDSKQDQVKGLARQVFSFQIKPHSLKVLRFRKE